MGNCGMYISNSSEYLTADAISKFNIKIVPDNTVLLSFKLTVGRVAITNGEMTTNEAIAHFVTDKKTINEYLYYYLKNFNFQTMGSTSSIATAVNSKIIKAMPFIFPTENELSDFHDVTEPMFSQIKANQQENTRLAALRDTLLPKLMKGEIDVSNVDISALTSADKLSFRCRSPPKKYLIDFPKYLFLIRQIVEFSFGHLWYFRLAICGICRRKISGDQPEVTSDQPEFFTIAQKPYGIRVSAKG